MKVLLVLALGMLALAAALPTDIIDIDEDHLEHEQDGIPGRAVAGEYSWVAPNGEEYKIEYIADHLGYRVLDDNVLPKAPTVDEEADE
ncbi:cuticle protein CP575 [Cherax quadricarinatus]|uniref:cuticle protein CP575 n=1 Tax=Cherax quadricarinatus TaxID=27406 RepID=UPI002378A03F|nr:cuticle protein CP575-like [Cherax quadricarinatus]